MKKKFTFLMAALMLLTIIGLPGKAVGQTRAQTTFSYSAYSGQGTSGSGSQCTANQNGITIESSKAYCASDHVKEYGGNNRSTITFSSSATISSIEITFKSGYTGSFVVPSGSPGSYSVSGTKGTWSGSATTVNLKNNANTQARWTQIVVTYTSSNPEITVDDALTVNPVAVTGGEMTVSYNNITPASGTITLYDGNNNVITPDWFSAAFNADFSKVIYSASENTTGTARSLRMHLHVANGSAEADADVAVTQDFILTTMDQICARATANGSTEKNVTVRLNNWVITEHNGGHTTSTGYESANKAWMTDATGTKGCVVYGTPKFNIDDVLKGTVNCKLKLFTGFPQLSNLNNSTTGLTITNTPGTVTAHTTTIGALDAVNTGSLVTLEGLTYNGSALTDGNNTITTANTLYTASLTSGHTYNVTGVFEYYKSGNTTTKKIYPRKSADIVEVTIPVISVVQSLTSFTYCDGDGPSEAQTFTVSGSDLEEDISLSMNNGTNSAFEISLSENSDYSNTLTLTKNGTTVSATTVYVRMKEELPIGGYSDAINLTSTHAHTATVNLTGTVTTPMVTWDLTTNSYSSASATSVTWSSSYVTMENAKGQSNTNANNYIGGGYNNNNLCTHTRFYQNHVLTFTPASGYAISSIEITATDNSYAGYFTSATWSNASASNANGKVTVTPTNGNNSVSATINTATRATSVTVYYEASTLIPHNITNDVDMANGTVVANPASAVAGATVTLKIYPDAGYFLEDDDDIEVDGTNTVTLNKVNAGTFTFTMPNEDVTVYALFSAYTGAYYTRVNSTANLIPGRHYIIATSKEAGDAYVMGGQSSGYRDAVSATVVGNTIYQTSSVREIVLSGDNTNFWTLYDDGTGNTSKGYLFAAGNENKLYVSDEYSVDNNYKWTISINNENGEANIVSQIEGANTIRFNNGTSPKRFTCYASGQMSVYLYMKGNDTNPVYYSPTSITVEDPDFDASHTTVLNNEILTLTGTVTCTDAANLIIEDGGQLITSSAVKATVKKNITAPTEWAPENKTGWYAISSTVGTISDITSSSFSNDFAPAGDFDLYKYVESSNNGYGWINYNNPAQTLTFGGLVNGQGYLYARKDGHGTTVSFKGSVNHTDVTLTGLTANNTANVNLQGIHFVGNPYTHNIYKGVALTATAGGMAETYYRLDGNNLWVVESDDTPIGPGQGFLVKVTKNNTSLTFSNNANSSKANNDYIRFAVSNSEYEDATFALFQKGEGLRKINHRNTEAPMIYISQNDANYASATMDDDTKSFNLNFEAKTMGQYKLSYKVNGEFNYLHVIDRTTGEDIDMLLEGSYSFIGSPMDNANRFIVRLGYLPNYEDNGQDIFAYQNGNDIVVSGEGELQIFDVMGRKVSTMNIYGIETVNGLAQGVYIFRLEGKTQKIVVR